MSTNLDDGLSGGRGRGRGRRLGRPRKRFAPSRGDLAPREYVCGLNSV
jgi:hypothetical protein